MIHCEVCDEDGPSDGGAMCRSCGASYDRYSKAGGGTVLDAIVWAARRARRTLFARLRRERRLSRDTRRRVS